MWGFQMGRRRGEERRREEKRREQRRPLTFNKAFNESIPYL